MSPEQVYRAALDCPDCLKGQQIRLLEFDDPLIEETGTNRHSLKNKEIRDEFAKKHDGINSYTIDKYEFPKTTIIMRTPEATLKVRDETGNGEIDKVWIKEL